MHWIVREIVGRATRRVTRIWFGKFESAVRRCREVQQQVLLRKIQRNCTSQFGRDHHFEHIRSVNDFRRQVPLTNYAYHEPYIQRVRRGEIGAMFGPGTKVQMFALTSGTTASPKFIPVTSEFLKEYRFGWMLWGIRCYDMHYDIYQLKVLQLSGNWTESYTEGGIPCGSISGLTMQGQCKIVRERYCVPYQLMRVQDVNSKYYAALRYSLPCPVGMAMAANPSTLINLARLGDEQKAILLRDLADGTLTADFDISRDVRAELEPLTRQRHPERVRQLEEVIERTGHLFPKDYWPCLQVLCNWTGGSMGAYLRHYPEYWGNVPVRDIGLIASEGRMTIPIEDGTRGGVLDILHQYYEFIPEAEMDSESPTVLEAHELQVGENYFILLTTSGGLYRYDIHDLVRCVGYHHATPVLEFLNKGAHFSSVTGEKLSEFQVCRAVEQCLAELDLRISTYTLAPCWSDPPYYALVLEASDLPDTATEHRLASLVDQQLSRQNIEYQAKRESHRLGPVSVVGLAAGAWDRFTKDMIRLQGATPEQYKHRCLTSDLEFIPKMQAQREILLPWQGMGLRPA